MNKKRPVIIHCHIFKNAGTTLDWSLQRSFGYNFYEDRNDKEMRTKAGYLVDLLRNNNISALSSHALRLPLPEVEEFSLIPLLLLRHPIDRIESVYRFEKIQPEITPGAIHAKKYSLEDYIRWRMSPEVGATIRNFQCMTLVSNLKKHAVVEEGDYRIAAERCRNLPALGIVDLYNESMILFEHYLRDNFPELDLSYIKQNVLRDSTISPDTSANRFLNNLSSEVAEMLVENNKYDIRLYNEARQLVLHRFESIDNHDDSLKEFKLRCNLIQNS
jgi:hypothetical protein